mmetsp:Transcript_13357/g.32646  ORF Transcript_13357/g.32646 Transcript_13357/m.32646 type:complete len:393 (-) Transcript_13357:3860-5038(-)
MNRPLAVARPRQAQATSRNRHTPRSVQWIHECLDLSCAVNTSSRKRASVVYTGHWYASFCSALSTVTARTRMTGMGQNSSLGRLSSSTPPLSSQRQPSSVRPWMKAPSRDAASTWSGCFLVTSVSTTVLSSGQSLRRAVVCITAVRKDCGLNRPDSHTTLGTPRSAVHSVSWFTRCSRFCSHEPSGRRLGYARLRHEPGTMSVASAFISRSMGSLMVRSPLRPRSSSASERFISASSAFMRSLSWMATMTYGVYSSTRPRMSSMSNWSGRRSTRSSSTILAFSSTLMPPSPPASRGCSCTSELQNVSASRSLNPISALGCRPKASGVSGGICSSMYSMTCLWFRLLGGLMKLGNISMPSSSSSVMYLYRYALASRLSQSSTMWPPYMISPKM